LISGLPDSAYCPSIYFSTRSCYDTVRCKLGRRNIGIGYIYGCYSKNDPPPQGVTFYDDITSSSTSSTSPTSSSTFSQTPTSSSYISNRSITSISDKLYYGDKLESVNKVGGKAPFISFNSKGQIIFTSASSVETVVLGSAISDVPVSLPTYTYITIVKEPPVNFGGWNGRITFKVTRNGITYYKKKIIFKIPTSTYTQTYLLISGDSVDNPWILTKDGVPLLSANTPVDGILVTEIY